MDSTSSSDAPLACHCTVVVNIVVFDVVVHNVVVVFLSVVTDHIVPSCGQ